MKKRYGAEQIVAKLRQADVELGKISLGWLRGLGYANASRIAP